MSDLNLEIKYGSTEGKYFTQWRFGVLKELLDALTFYHEAKVLDINMWYDSENDYHMMSFSINDCRFEIRYYKVFGCTINGVRSNNTWLPSSANSLAKYLVDASGSGEES